MGARPGFRWHGPAGSTLELSQSRTFAGTVLQLRGDGEGIPEQPLKQGLWFWHVKVLGRAPSPFVWHFTIARGVDRTVRSGVILGSDYDGDGLTEIGVPGGLARVAGGSAEVVVTEWRLGNSVPQALRRDAGEPELQWDRPRGLGDLDGDGRADGSVYSMRRALMPDGRVPVRLLLSAAETGEVTAYEELPYAAVPLDDVDGDGHADLGVCAKSQERCDVRSGSSASSYAVLAELGPCASLASADMDGDGFGDVWCKTRGGDLALYPGSAAGLVRTAVVTLSLKLPRATLLSSEVDGDGLGDLLVADPESSSIRLVAGKSDLASLSVSPLGKWSGASLSSQEWTYFPASQGTPASLVALDRRGAESNSLGVYWAEQIGSGKFTLPGKYQALTDSRAPVSSVENVGDVDGDGVADAMFTLVQDADGTKEYWLERRGAPREQRVSLVPPWKGAEVAPFPDP